MAGSLRTSCGISVSRCPAEPPAALKCGLAQATLLFIEAVKARFKPSFFPTKAKMMNAAKAGASSWKSDMTLALLAMLVALAVNATTGFRELSNAGGDNDSLLRLVE